MGLIEGTKTLGESLASIAKSLAKMFLNAAFQNIFNNMFQISEQGSYNRAGSFKAFQYGGVVNSPTLGMIGEGGEPEYVIPASKMDGAMSRYSAGARGGAVIPGGSHESGTVAGSSGNAIVEYTGPVLKLSMVMSTFQNLLFLILSVLLQNKVQWLVKHKLIALKKF